MPGQFPVAPRCCREDCLTHTSMPSHTVDGLWSNPWSIWWGGGPRQYAVACPPAGWNGWCWRHWRPWRTWLGEGASAWSNQLKKLFEILKEDGPVMTVYADDRKAQVGQWLTSSMNVHVAVHCKHNCRIGKWVFKCSNFMNGPKWKGN